MSQFINILAKIKNHYAAKVENIAVAVKVWFNERLSFVVFESEIILTILLLQLVFGLVLTLLALIGFLFNFYIVLALVLTKQVDPPNHQISEHFNSAASQTAC